MTNEEIAAEVHDLAARRDIMACINRYMRAQDRCDPELHKSAFHPDAFVDCGPVAGDVETFVQYAQAGLAQCHFTHHMIGQVDLLVDGDRATGEVYFIAYHRMALDDEETDMIFGGRYVDEYARRGGEWRIVRRCEIADWTRTEPAADRFFAMEPAYRRGEREGRDFSSTRAWPMS
ncbi:nuclear transport factor 2 family protein [Croceicoccus mobilis]|uniref:SnoaL-like domain-containing protein n=1 Tax=Croceicoccus mobilis TaxID=1703339 RepID=A0A917DZ11_9SPHN|nr:nuclear transport factor 2 family protein [Croceicoccus mobilis]GGD80539.1 hypothetical protein GCM10010990_33010 [Croceicoccus mobilis]